MSKIRDFYNQYDSDRVMGALIERETNKHFIERKFKEGRKYRKCLRCKISFISQWSGNRICNPCNKAFDVYITHEYSYD